MDTAIYTFFGYEMPLERRMELIRGAGFDAVMLWWGCGTGCYEGNGADAARLARAQGLWVCNAHLPLDDANNLWLTGAAGDAYEADICRRIEQMGRHGVPTAVLHLTRGRDIPPPCKTGLCRLARMLECAAAAGVKIAFENLNFPVYLDYVFAYFPVDAGAYFCFDSGHNHYFSPGRDLLTQYKNRLIALHLNDNFGTKDYHMLPFDGGVNWRHITQALQKMQYSGPLSIEPEQPRHECYKHLTPAQYLAKAYEKTCKLADMMLPLSPG